MNILVVSPHPDDETLGAGGTILRLMQEGNAVSWLNITGIQGNPDYSNEYRENRERQLNNIEKFYDFPGWYILTYRPQSWTGWILLRQSSKSQVYMNKSNRNG